MRRVKSEIYRCSSLRKQVISKDLNCRVAVNCGRTTDGQKTGCLSHLAKASVTKMLAIQNISELYQHTSD